MSEYLVEMEHIVKTFPGVKALDDVQFHLKSGEVDITAAPTVGSLNIG